MKTVAGDKKMPATTRKWVFDNFAISELIRTAMAFHVLVFTCHWAATSGMENTFNIWKKYLGAVLKRSLLCDAISTVLEMVERRIVSDCLLLTDPKKKWFIDMRQTADFDEAVRQHKKKLSTYMMFQKERSKLQDATCCPWASAVRIDGTCMFLLQERKEAKKDSPACVRIHLVNLEGFDWADSESNIPPTCLTCPTFLQGRTPCIGILTTLSNLKPLPGTGRPESVTAWLGTNHDLCKPEIFNNRWRTDKDPTQYLAKYSLVGRRPQQTDAPQDKNAPRSDLVLEDDLRGHLEEAITALSELPERRNQQALVSVKAVMTQIDRIVAKHVLDETICKTSQVSQCFCVRHLLLYPHTC